MAEFNWPRKLLRPNSVQLTLNERNLSTSPSASGYTQVVSSGPPIWSATFGGIDLRTSQQRILWRALAALVEGRRNIILVPFCRGDQPVTAGVSTETVNHSDGSSHSDGAPYNQKLNDVKVAVGAPAGAVFIALDINTAGEIQPGNYLSIDNRLYIIRGKPSATSIAIWPPLRKPILAGNFIEFDNPTCRMRLASDQEMAVDFQRLRFGTASVSFIEDLT